MKKRKIKKGVLIFILCISLLAVVAILFIVYKDNFIKIKNNSYVKITNNTKLYTQNKKVIGSIKKNTVVKIANKENNYYKLYKSNIYIKSGGLKSINYKEEKESSYIISYNKNIKINNKIDLYKNNKKVITINNGINAVIKESDNSNYYISYFGNTFSIKKDKNIKEIKNSKYKESDTVVVINYNEITDKECITCINEKKYLEQINYLKENNYYNISLKDYDKYINGYISVKDKGVLLTTSKENDLVKKLNKENKLKLVVNNNKDLNFVNSSKTPNKDKSKLNRYNIKSNTTIDTFKKMLNKENVYDPYPFKASSNEQAIPVLNYHFFYDSSKGEACNEHICLDTSMFEKHLKYLKDNGYKTLTIEEFTEWMYGDIELPEKSVLLTVDDGAAGTGKHNGNKLIPLLEKYNLNATLFLITGWWDIKNYQSKNLDVNSHTNDMHNKGECGMGQVVCATEEKLLGDLNLSLQVVKDINSFCFPFYQYDEKSLKTVEKAGFKISFIGENRKAKRSDNRYKIPRYPIHSSHTFEDFVNMIN